MITLLCEDKNCAYLSSISHSHRLNLLNRLRSRWQESHRKNYAHRHCQTAHWHQVTEADLELNCWSPALELPLMNSLSAGHWSCYFLWHVLIFSIWTPNLVKWLKSFRNHRLYIMSGWSYWCWANTINWLCAAKCQNSQRLMGKSCNFPPVCRKWSERCSKGTLLITITACLFFSLCVYLLFVCVSLPGLWPSTEADLCCKCNSHEARGALMLLLHTDTHMNTHSCVAAHGVSVYLRF